MSKFGFVDYNTKYEIKGKKIICNQTTNMNFNGDKFIIHSRGVSRCNPQDRFDTDFGKALALARAEQYFHKKVEKRLIQYSNRNSEKKNNEVLVWCPSTQEMFFINKQLLKDRL